MGILDEMFFKIKFIMKSKKITQKEISEKLNITIKTVNNVLTRRNVGYDTLEKIINYIEKK